MKLVSIMWSNLNKIIASIKFEYRYQERITTVYQVGKFSDISGDESKVT
jgi:hypothetical protein